MGTPLGAPDGRGISMFPNEVFAQRLRTFTAETPNGVAH